MDVCACLLLCFVSMFVYLDLDFAMLCALFGLVFFGFWGYLLVWLHMSLLWFVWVWPLMRHISVMLVCLIHTFLYSMRCWYVCLAALCHPFSFLCFFYIFAHLPACSCMNLCVVYTIIQWNYGHPIQTYIFPLRTPSICLITWLFALFYMLSMLCFPLFGSLC